MKRYVTTVKRPLAALSMPIDQKIFSLLFVLLLAAQGVFAQQVTFAEDIAPIIHTNCTPCHQKDGGAPFSLVTYKEVAKRAKFIGHVTASGYMPPWKADTTYRRYSNEKVLTKTEIGLIQQWVAQKTPAGDLSKINYTPQSQTVIHEGDVAEFKLGSAFELKDDLKEKFVISVVPFDFDKEQNVSLIDFIADNRTLVHHANYGIFSVDEPLPITGLEQPQEANNLSEEFKRRYGQLTRNLVYYNGYIPGASPIKFPAHTGFVMPKRGVVVFTNHYAPTAVTEYDQSSLKIYFTDDNIERSVTALSIGSGGVGEIKPPLTILPNTVSEYKVSVETGADFSLMYVWPHMHLLGKAFKAYAVTPSNDTIPLINIPEWDFNWQEAYKLERFLKIPAESVITVEGIYDNTTNNPQNPFNPPRTIYSDGYMETTDEMLSFIIMFVDYKIGDEQTEL